MYCICVCTHICMNITILFLQYWVEPRYVAHARQLPSPMCDLYP